MSDGEASEGEHRATHAGRHTRMLAGYADIVGDAAAFALGERVLDAGRGCGDLSLAAGHAVDG